MSESYNLLENIKRKSVFMLVKKEDLAEIEGVFVFITHLEWAQNYAKQSCAQQF